MIPASFYIALAIAALSLLGGVGIGTKWSEHKLLRLQASHAEALAAQARDAQSSEAAARAEERRRAFRIQESADAANLQAADARSAAARADCKSGELLNAYTTVASALGRAGAGTATADSGTATAGSGLVLTDVFRRSDAQLRSCAAALDQSRIAGLACERAYDSLTLLSTKD